MVSKKSWKIPPIYNFFHKTGALTFTGQDGYVELFDHSQQLFPDLPGSHQPLKVQQVLMTPLR